MNEYPLHWYVYENNIPLLKQQLAKTSKETIDAKDLRGKTALELAIFLNHYECAKAIVEHGADCCIVTSAGWNLVQEAVSTGNAQLVKLIMTYRDFQRTSARTNGIPELLNKLKQAPDFYVEMKWEFTSWIPLISKACPSDVYKIYKSGSNVRIDTTLIGFNGTTWERGNRSYIFKATTTPDADCLATIVEIDHMLNTFHVDKLTSLVEPIEDASSREIFYEPDESMVQTKLTSPSMVTFLDIEKIEFERNRSGLWGWRTDKSESINSYDCKVYAANNLQLVTKTRVEHLNSEQAKAFLDEMDENERNDRNDNNNLPGFITNMLTGTAQKIKIEKSAKPLTALEYFQKVIPVDYYLNGSVRTIDETRKTQSFNATLSLAESYPLSLHEQVLPIVDLMALNNSHFKKLKEFITLQLPSGFPVKIEIPIYRVITAKVTFGNIFALDKAVHHVNQLRVTASTSNIITNNQNAKVVCAVDERVFKIPSGYRCTNMTVPELCASDFEDDRRPSSQLMPPLSLGATSRHGVGERMRYGAEYGYRGGIMGGAAGLAMDEDDYWLQVAIQQSLGHTTDHDSGAAAAATVPRDTHGGTQSLEEYQQRRNDLYLPEGQFDDEEEMLQRVLAASLVDSNVASGGGAVVSPDSVNVTTTTTTTQQQESPNTQNDIEMLRIALEMSRREDEERRRRVNQEDDELEQAVRLSLLDK